MPIRQAAHIRQTGQAGRRKKALLCLAAALAVVLGSLLLEFCIFQRHILRVPKSARVVEEVPLSQLILTDLAPDDAGGFRVIGENPSFRLPGNGFVGYLRLTADAACHVTVDDGRLLDLNPSRKADSYLRVDDNCAAIDFRVTPNATSGTFPLRAVAVDNRMHVNGLRIFLMISVGLLAIFLIAFWRQLNGRIWIVLFALVAVFGINFALDTPVSGNFDEPAHFVRAYALAQFDFGLQKDAESNWIADIDTFLSNGLANSSTYNSYPEREAYVARYSTRDYPVRRHIDSSAATYPFVPYSFAALGIFLARLFRLPFIVTFYAGRICNVLGYAFLCACAVKIAKLGKRILFLVALLPFPVFSAASYTADMATTACSLLAVALFTDMLAAAPGSLRLRQPLLFGACVCVTVMCKLPYAPLWLLLLAVPFRNYASRKTAWCALAASAALVGVISLLTLLYGKWMGIVQWPFPGVDARGQISYILHHPARFVGTIVRRFTDGWQEILSGSTTFLAYCGKRGLFLTSLCVYLLFGCSLIDSEPRSNLIAARQRLIFAALIVLSWTLIVTALYVTFTAVGAKDVSGVQGRYFLPLFAPLLFLLRWDRVTLRLGEGWRNGICTVCSGCFLAQMVLSVLLRHCA